LRRASSGAPPSRRTGLASAPLQSAIAARAQPKHENERQPPDHALERDVVIRLEVTLQAAQPDDRDHDEAAFFSRP